MSTQSEALRRVADLEAMHERGTIKRGHIDEMLSELRRLHEVNQELLEVLNKIATVNAMDHEYQTWAHAAIIKATGESK